MASQHLISMQCDSGLLRINRPANLLHRVADAGQTASSQLLDRILIPGNSPFALKPGPSNWSRMEFDEIFLYDRSFLADDEPADQLDERRSQPPSPVDPGLPDGGADDHVKLPCMPLARIPGEHPRWLRIVWQLQSEPQTIDGWIRLMVSCGGGCPADYELVRVLLQERLPAERRDEHLRVTLPAMAALAVRLPRLLPGSLPRLRQHRNRCLHLTQEQAACLLANAFFGTFPGQESPEARLLPYINFKW